MKYSSLILAFAFVPTVAVAEKIDFSSQVLPILSDRCFHCHGPDSQNQDSEFRLDDEEHLFADLGGYAGVVPGDPDASELITRIRSDDEYDVMPPPDSNRSLSEDEKRILQLWIQQGAEYEGHWAFDRPKKADVPREIVSQSDWPEEQKERWSQNPIDAFIGRRLMEEGITPSDPADPATLLRRVSLTLTGLLPSEQQINRFVAEPSDEAYAEIINEFLGSMGYAERQALLWLDAARYADTDGYQVDQERTNWPWRDWVIQAFHNNMPFDEFTIEQLAGDMLPNATDSQRLATAFNRNHRQNNEAGALPEEFSVENTIDRVETTSTVWLGLTMGCARCHDHKYDPLSQREFYQFFAYFNNIGERGVGKGVNADPTIKAFSPLAEVDPDLLIAVKDAQAALDAAQSQLNARADAWIEAKHTELQSHQVTWNDAKILDADLTGEGILELKNDNTVVYSAENANGVTYELSFLPDGLESSKPITAIKIEALPDERFTKPLQLAPSVNGNFVLTNLEVSLGGNSVAIKSISANAEQSGYDVAKAIDDDPRSGWAVFGSVKKAAPVHAILTLKDPIPVDSDATVTLSLHFNSQFKNHSIGKLRVQWSQSAVAEFAGLDADLAQRLRKPADKRSQQDIKKLREHYQSIDPELKAAKQRYNAAEYKLTLQAGPRVNVMVMRERQGGAKPAYLLNRGQYDQPNKDEPLPRGIPAALLGRASEQSSRDSVSVDDRQPSNRLELARWLVSRDNPLTARVIVNRLWQNHFGVGLVKTSEDFGLQGETPSHPELLDFLAVELMDSGWDIQAMHRMIVTSAAFRQSSKHRPELSSIDPGNRLLARGPRYRADGFTIRDVALQASGTLNEKAGGPPVKPYQPDGLWETVAANAGTRYAASDGGDLYRKSMYTYWKRAVNPPRQIIFDAAGREVCNVQVRRTNTPLQALVLMNDPTFIEAARNLAEKTLQSHEANDEQRIRSMYAAAVSRQPSEASLDVMRDNLSYFRQHYQQNANEAEKLLSIGQSKRDESLNAIELAATTMVAHLIMNTDKFVTIE
ncbi:PSD1 and planctomycete cytochrome C domain-containing protein [Rhodopirellula halodulae]|uniref:PSD1 and planctomycete cytochrome C domain-containing protein n=1 Tax=Rhodopirellula halodulae TaxID=2894198 RepID=UPI001E2824E0|nr:PSD1 and planctomycete cytochrome C domain-containing protein [Rhodopirellula sp. JC737]MCC9658076.1 PSD1 and planctomycete cytochrome C domain-containing protein [Rhodopirellula sp. JC737]